MVRCPLPPIARVSGGLTHCPSCNGGHEDGNVEAEKEAPKAGPSPLPSPGWGPGQQPLPGDCPGTPAWSSLGAFDVISSLPTGHRKFKGFLFFYCNSLEG